MLTDLDFQKIFYFIMKQEGGYVNHPADSGKETNRGVTQLTFNQYRISKKLPTTSVKNITNDEVMDIFKNNYWNKVVKPDMDAKYALVLVDLSYNSGTSRALRYNSIANGDIKKIIEMRKEFYNRIVKNDPTQKVFLKGWMNRIKHLEEYIAAWDLIQF